MIRERRKVGRPARVPVLNDAERQALRYLAASEPWAWALLALDAGTPLGDVARQAGVHPATVWRWCRRYAADGWVSCKRGPRKGRREDVPGVPGVPGVTVVDRW